MKQASIFLSLLYSLVVIFYGFLGYQKGSLPSLYFGVGLGSLLLLSSAASLQKKGFAKKMTPLLLCTLGILFAIRFGMTQKMFLLGLSLGAFCILGMLGGIFGGRK